MVPKGQSSAILPYIKDEIFVAELGSLLDQLLFNRANYSHKGG